jgi:hypothetical protein
MGADGSWLTSVSQLEPTELVLTSVSKKKSADGSFFYFRRKLANFRENYPISVSSGQTEVIQIPVVLSSKQMKRDRLRKDSKSISCLVVLCLDLELSQILRNMPMNRIQRTNLVGTNTMSRMMMNNSMKSDNSNTTFNSTSIILKFLSPIEFFLNLATHFHRNPGSHSTGMICDQEH